MTRLTLILLATCATPAVATQESDGWHQRVLPLVRAAFPELASRPLQVRETDDGTALVIALAPTDAVTLEGRAARQLPQVIVRLGFDEHGRLQEVVFSGPLTHEAERQRHAGAHEAAAPSRAFGPGDEDAIRERVPLAALRTLVGPLLIESVTYDPGREEWTILLSSGPAPGWRITLEPFGGRLVRRVRLEGER